MSRDTHKHKTITKLSNYQIIKLVVAGGGTGGHVFPGMAVAEAMESYGRIDILWIGTGRPVEKMALSGRKWAYQILETRPLRGSGLAGTIRSLAGLPFSTIRAFSWLKSFRPHVVLGVGGYVSGPVLLAARMLRIPAALHEQNLIPGLTNRLASRFAKTVFVSFKKTVKYFPKNRVIFTGNPVRKSIIQSQKQKLPNYQITKLPNLLVLGGSQGARCLNRLAGSAIKVLWQSDFHLEIIHQTGKLDVSYVEKFYKDANIPAKVTPFISNIGESYSWADLVICRAGASTLAELATMGKPSILIPYPWATESHQDANARELSEAGAAKYFLEGEIGAIKLAGEIQSLLEDPQKLINMGENARKLGKPTAAAEMASTLIEMAGHTFSYSETETNSLKGSIVRNHV
ncbi:MAG: undecaprenyldiphospho-muramoylpentapeptide beta-N-acetylglucosaminyltransferase [Deltaproteobacteria bacterium]|nr:undecaprenyldiphospho-muramoylpentapeptide beta-N-acetylglucosaminyltransferase [Deltaproteobacteria bacterium]MBW1931618.1 undecaprenyldiphospho-muramoylpentapeptide beta-N-acetylglucosaminyltransferase [Deltaproteobacteria bacterium]MBW1937457.1 undecaprenyldiphospho-muramoylpentapeptide beta-N-acetylglucosaminyltransferase [Deltaproteobacteria bacterium]MBW1964202.1 undecaprenyldiphospho-muramoylpentapeptide beta-N-acetylglucosaminyltransferase [Deltaproteobacteria bacterium]